MSLPTRERGLKPKLYEVYCLPYPSLPTRERGLKHKRSKKHHLLFGSLPTRERGLKPGIPWAPSAPCGRSLRGSVD